VGFCAIGRRLTRSHEKVTAVTASPCVPAYSLELGSALRDILFATDPALFAFRESNERRAVGRGACTRTFILTTIDTIVDSSATRALNHVPS